MKPHEKYIKAITSIGGDLEDEYAAYLTEANEASFEAWLSEQPKIDGVTLYRGYRLEKSFFEDGDYSEGAILSPLSLTEGFHPAFTDSELRAVRYMNEFGTSLDDYIKILFELHTKGMYMTDVSEHSVYPCEAEHHCCADAKFKVVKTERKGGFTRIIIEEI